MDRQTHPQNGPPERDVQGSTADPTGEFSCALTWV
jgi:hypothetical protein